MSTGAQEVIKTSVALSASIAAAVYSTKKETAA